MTFTNAVHYAWHRCRDDETRRLLLLQNAAFLPLFRGEPVRGVAIDTLEPLPRPLDGSGCDRGDLRRDQRAIVSTAARKVLGFLEGGGDAQPLADARAG